MYRQKFREYKQILRSTTILLATVAVLTISSSASAQLTPPGNPNSPQAQMPSLDQIHQKLTTGSTTPIQTGYVGPSGGPTHSTMYSLNQLMDLMPALDNDDCAKPEDVLNGKRYWGLCSDNWGPRMGTASSLLKPLARTGLTTCYDASGLNISCTNTGQDGEYQAGVAWPDPRFTDNGDGTITDNLTGLIWLKHASCFDTSAWEQAFTDASGLSDGNCGLNDGSVAGDWRVPNIRELRSIINYEVRDMEVILDFYPFIDLAGAYWSSNTYAPDTSMAWYVHIFGMVDRISKTGDDYTYLLPVR